MGPEPRTLAGRLADWEELPDDPPQGAAPGGPAPAGAGAARAAERGRSATVLAPPDQSAPRAAVSLEASARTLLAAGSGPTIAAVAAAAAAAAGEPEDPYIGRLLGQHYQVLERLGAGGMGIVYLVEHLHLHKRFAAKVLNAEIARRPDAVARFEQEAIAASQLDHDHIVNVVDFGRSADGTVYLVMELLRGEPLNELMARGPMPLDDVARIIVPVCRALGAAHRAGIVHRDMKPENVFLSTRPDGRCVVKLLDFGLSKIKEKKLSEGRLTQTGQVLGSPLYMSPEASRGATDLDQRTDIYAVGVMLYEMLTGRPPFHAENYLEVLYRHVHDEPPPPTQLRPDLPPALERIVLRAMAKDRALRYQALEELEGDLLDAFPVVAVEMTLQPSGPRGVAGRTPILSPLAVPLRTTTLRAWTGRRGRAAAVVGSAVVVVAIGGWVALRPAGVPTVVAPPPPVTPARPQAAPPPAAPPAAAPAAAITLRVTTLPPGAAVYLDDRLVGSAPIAERLPPSSAEHGLRVALPGFVAESQRLTLDRDRAVTVALRRARRARPAALADPGIKVGR